MANTKLNLDRQATAKDFSFGSTAAGDDALVTINNGTAAASNVVLDVKGAAKLNVSDGVLIATSGVVGSGDSDDVAEGSSNLYYTDARVRLNRLDQMAAPTADVSLNSQKITNLATPTAASDAATKGYVDAQSQGLDVKASVRAASPGEELTLSGTQTVDGVALQAGDRVLVKDQFLEETNGIYVVAAGAWSRAADADSSAEVTAGMFVFVEEGSQNADSGWVLTTDGSITLGTTDLNFVQFSGAGQIVAGAGLAQSGNTLSVNVDNNSLEINADALRIKPGGISNSMIGDGEIDLTTKVQNTLAVDYGGTGHFAYTNGQLLIGNTATGALSKATLTAGSGISVTNGNGSITIAATGSAGYHRATTVSGTQDSSNKIFTIGNELSSGSEQVFLNGQLLTPGSSNDYVLSSTTLTFQAAIDAPAATDVIRVYGTY